MGPDEPLLDALRAASADATGADRLRIVSGVNALQEMMPRVVLEFGHGSAEHISALEALASGQEQLGQIAEAIELWDVLADTQAARGAESADSHAREDAIEGELNARARATVLRGVLDADAPTVAAMDALISRSEQHLGTTHPCTLWLLSLRAERLVRTRGPDELEAFDLVIARAVSAGEDGPAHLSALASKAKELARLGRDNEAAALFRRVREGRRTMVGMDDPGTLDAWRSYVMTLARSGAEAQALAECEELIPALQRGHGEDDPRTLEMLRYRIDLQRGLGAQDAALLDRARDGLQHLMALQTARFGPDSAEVFTTRAVATELVGDVAAARADAHAVVEEARASLGPDDPALVAIGLCRQRVLRRSLAEGNDDIVRAEGALAVDQLVGLALKQAITGARTHTADLPDRLQGISMSLHHLNDWWPPASPEKIDTFTRWADRLTAAATAELVGHPEVLERAAELHEHLAHELLAAGENAASGRHSRLARETYRHLSGNSIMATEAHSRAGWCTHALAESMRRMSAFQDAETELAEGIRAADAAGADDDLIDALHQAHAYTLSRLDRHDEAITEFQTLWSRTGDPTHAFDLAAGFLSGGRPADAEELLRSVRDSLDSAGEGHSPLALRIRGNLALAACHQDRHAEAAAGYDDLLELQRLVLPPETRDQLTTKHNRAVEELHLARLDTAISRFEEVVQNLEALSGAEDPQTLGAKAGLAEALARAGSVDRALAVMNEVLGLSRKLWGPTHPHSLAHLRTLDVIRKQAGLPPDDAFDVPREDVPDGNGAAQLRFAEQLLQEGRTGEALVRFTRARDAYAAEGGLGLLAADRGIAVTLQAMGNIREAADAFARVVPQLERLVPDDHWAHAELLELYSIERGRLGEVDEMIALQRRAIAAAERAGSDAERTLWMRVMFARRLAQVDRPEDARREQDAAQAFADAHAGEIPGGLDHPARVTLADDISASFAAAGQHRQAAAILKDTLPRLVAVHGAGSPEVAAANARYQAARVHNARGIRIAAYVVLGLIVVGVVVSFFVT